MSLALWWMVCRRLVLSQRETSGNPRAVARPFDYDVSTPLEGIIAHLARKYGRNLHENGIVTVTTASPQTGDPMDSPENVLDLASTSAFYSANAPGQWICFDFHEMKVTPTHYVIRSCCTGFVNGNNLKSWVLEGSEDGESWVELDRRVKNRDLNAGGAIQAFAISTPKECRCLRLVQTQRNHGRTNTMIISAFEVFGTLRNAIDE
jgi:hypothetical protein